MTRAELDSLLVRLVVGLFFLSALSPYITFVPLGTDTQPYAMLLAALLVAASPSKRVRPELVVLFVPLLGGMLILLVSGIDFTGLRSLSNYVSVALIPYATYLCMKSHGGLFRRLLEFTVWVWGVAALLEVIAGPNVLGFMLADVRTTANRGVTGLAPEPTHYGVQCVFFLFLVLMEFEGRKRTVLSTVLVAQILLLAQSTMATLFLIGLLGIYLLTHLNSPRRTAFAALLAGAGILGLVLASRIEFFRLGGSRLFALGSMLVQNPGYLLLIDGSGNARLSSILFSFYGFLDAWMLPNGFDRFPAYAEIIAPRFRDIILHVPRMDRIMSGYGAALFELGILGLLIPVVFTRLLWLRYRYELALFLVFGIGLNVLLLAAIPLANPIIGLLIGYVAYEGTRTGDGLGGQRDALVG